MKRTIISTIFLITGLLIILGLALCASLYLPTITSWSNSYPSRLFFVIFAGESRYGDVTSGFGLGWLFIIGLVMFFFGIVALLREYLKKD